ncbi:MAG: hypothetical protein P9M08_00185 [Candidatus Erginobacter occultus]|nr:hypothetical protein [Candidatus Erginobacter occultus]
MPGGIPHSRIDGQLHRQQAVNFMKDQKIDIFGRPEVGQKRIEDKQSN